MSTFEQTIHEAQVQRKQIFEQLQNLGAFRPGSFIERYVTCGNPNCHCAQPGDKRHGPHYLITRKVHKQTVSKPIKQSEAAIAKTQVERYQLFQSLIHDLVEVNIRICDTELAMQEAAAEGTAAKKRGSRQNSPRK